MKLQIICGILVILFINFQLQAQKLNPAEEQIFKAEATKFVERYYEMLPPTIQKLDQNVKVPSVNEEGAETELEITYKQQFIERYFENNDIYVYNDLSPDDENERSDRRVMTIDNYLDEVKTTYGEKKVEQFKTSLVSAQVEEIGYNDKAFEKFYYAKVKVKRKLTGMYLGEYYTENTKELDFYIKTIDKAPQRLKKYQIIGIDYESQQVLVGNIGVEAAIAKGLRFFDKMDYEQAFPYLIKYSQEKAFQKNANATWALSFMYFWGWGTDRSDDEMVKWMTLSADRNNLYALYYLGENYYYGEYGVDEDEKKAFKLIKEAARKGYDEAQYFLGQRFEKGEGIRQSNNAAKRWYRRAAEQGHVKAKFSLKKLENN